jgi:hypothetical protein
MNEQSLQECYLCIIFNTKAEPKDSDKKNDWVANYFDIDTLL